MVLLVVFGLGVNVGYRKAVFASRSGENYYHNFLGTAPNGFSGPMPMNPHGIAGMIFDISSTTLSVRDPQGNEESVVVSGDTIIRETNETVSVSELAVGDQVAVIGEPNDQGQIRARFIRVFEVASPMAPAHN